MYNLILGEDDSKFIIHEDFQYEIIRKNELITFPIVFISNNSENTENYIKTMNSGKIDLAKRILNFSLIDYNQLDNDQYIRPVDNFIINDISAAKVNPDIDSVQVAKAGLFSQVFVNETPDNIITNLDELTPYELKDVTDEKIINLQKNAKIISYLLECNCNFKDIESYSLVQDINNPDNIYYSFTSKNTPSQTIVPIDLVEEMDINLVKSLEFGIRGCEYEDKINNIIASDMDNLEKKTRISNHFRNLYQFLEENIKEEINKAKENEEYILLKDTNPLTKGALTFLGVENITQVPIAILEPLINEGLDNLSDNLKYSGHENLSKLITYTRKIKNVTDIIDNPITVGKNIGDIKIKKNSKDNEEELENKKQKQSDNGLDL